jgi:hypothetical protein
MEVLFHFIFELIKISILGAIYASLTLLIFKTIVKFKPNSWFERVSQKKLKFLFLGGLIISTTLFIYMFSYWGNHGFGDGPRIPMGHGIIVDNTNWTEYGYISDINTSDNHKIEMTKFLVFEDKLLGNLDSWFNDFKNGFFIYDMNSQEIREFKTISEFDQYALSNNLPSSEKLLTFEVNYKNRWSGWRFWLLP